MSHVDEALKRAKASTEATGADPSAAAHPGPVPPAVPSPDVFAAPWAFDDPAAPQDRSARAASAPAQSPVAEVPGDAAVTEATDPSTASQRASDLAAVQPASPSLFRGFNPAMAEKIVTMPAIRPAFVEQYRKLASALHHAQLEHNLKVLMVTSSLAGEGKTLTSTNLALTLSESYRRTVLLIDADLRRPTLHEAFQLSNVAGLGDGLRAAQDQKLSLTQVSTHLTLLTAGRPDPDPMSGLTSDRMRRVIEEASLLFEWVILDTPPVGLLPDAKLLGSMVDTAILVVRAGRTPYRLVQNSIETLGRDRILGVILNQADERLVAGGYGYYSYYDSYAKRKSS